MEYKRIINLLENTPYDTSKDLICKKEESKCNTKIKKKVIIFDDVTKENKKSIIQIDHKIFIICTGY